MRHGVPRFARVLVRILLAASAAAIIAACGSKEVAVMVRDEDRKPVADVEVHEAGSGRLLGTTAADGRTHFELKHSGHDLPQIRLSQAPGTDASERLEFDDSYALRPENFSGTPRLIYVWHESAGDSSAFALAEDSTRFSAGAPAETPDEKRAIAGESSPPSMPVSEERPATPSRTEPPAAKPSLGTVAPAAETRPETKPAATEPAANTPREKTYLVSAAPFAEIYLDARSQALNPGGAPVSVSLREGHHTFRLVNAAAGVDLTLAYDVHADDPNNVLILNWEEKLVKPKRSAQRLPGVR